VDNLKVMARLVAEASAAFVAAAALGYALDALAERELLGLHRIPIGAIGAGGDLELDGLREQQSWLPVPLCLLDMALVWLSSAAWQQDSWWASCLGAVWGQLCSLAVCVFTVLPAVLSAWLLWMPTQCSPLPIL
jgi:hypothetical protein